MDHKRILAALIKKDARAAKLAMWQHLENVKRRLLEFSNVDDIYFDGYLFDSGRWTTRTPDPFCKRADIARPRAPCRCAAIIDNDSHFIVALPAQW